MQVRLSSLTHVRRLSLEKADLRVRQAFQPDTFFAEMCRQENVEIPESAWKG